MMSSTGEAGKPLFLGTVDNNQLSDQEKQALLDNAVHEAKWVDQDGKKRLACAACTKTFSDRGHLRTHYNTVHLKTMYKCTVIGCEEWFNSMRARQRHIQNIHTPKQPSSQMTNAAATPVRSVPQPMQQPAAIQPHYHSQVIHTPGGQQAIRHQQPMLQQRTMTPQQPQVAQHIHSQPSIVQQAPQQPMIQSQTSVHQQVVSQHQVVQPSSSVQSGQLMQVQQPVQHQIMQQQQPPQQQQHVYQTQQPMQAQMLQQQPQTQGVQQQQHVMHQQQYFQQQQPQQQPGSGVRPLPQMQSVQPMTQHQPMQHHVIHQQQTTVLQSVPQHVSQPAHHIQQSPMANQHGIVSGVSQTVAAQQSSQDSQHQQQQTGSVVSQPYMQNAVYQTATTLQPAQTVVMSTTQSPSIASHQATQQVVLTSQPSQCANQVTTNQQPIAQVQVIGSTGYAVAAQPNQCNHMQQQQPQQQQTVNVVQQSVEIAQVCPEHKQMHQHQPQTQTLSQPLVQQHQHSQVQQTQQQPQAAQQLQQQAQSQPQTQQQNVQSHVSHQCPVPQHGHQSTAFIANVPSSGNQINGGQIPNSTTANTASVTVSGGNYQQTALRQANKIAHPIPANQVHSRQTFQQSDISHQQQLNMQQQHQNQHIQPQAQMQHQQPHHQPQQQPHAQQQQIPLSANQQQPLQHSASTQPSVQFSNQVVPQPATQHEQSCSQHPQNQSSLPYQQTQGQHVQFNEKRSNHVVSSGQDVVIRQAVKRSSGGDVSASDGDAPPAKLVATDPLSAGNEESSNVTNQEQDIMSEDDEFSELMEPKNTHSFAINQSIESLLAFIKRLQDMDANGFFAYPMTEMTHPGCSTQLDRLSDLYNVKKQIRLGRYSSLSGLQSLREEFDLIFTNAMKYYEEKSPEYRLAAKLWKVAEDGMVTLTAELTTRFPQLFGPDAEIVSDLLDVNTDLFHRLQADGKTASLGFLQPDNRGHVGRKHRVRTIGEEVGRPANCVGPQPPLRDDRRNKIIPVSYLDYGSFASFAPTYDSGAAYCTKEDSDLVLGEFGFLPQSDSPDAQLRARQRQELVDETSLIVPEPELGDDFSLYLLNAFTKDLLREERDSHRTDSTSDEASTDQQSAQPVVDGSEEPEQQSSPTAPSNEVIASGEVCDETEEEKELSKADTQVEEGKEEKQSEEDNDAECSDKVEECPQRMLEETASTLGKLREANYARLQQPHSRMAQVPAVEEQALADRVVASLAVMVGCNKPDDVVSNSALHRTMNVDLAGSTTTATASEVAASKNPVACGEA